MPLDSAIAAVTDRIRDRSRDSPPPLPRRVARAGASGPRRAHLSCGNQAHAYAAMGEQKTALVGTRAPERRHRHRLQRHAFGASAL
jgi:phosphogluconate dehydratase